MPPRPPTPPLRPVPYGRPSLHSNNQALRPITLLPFPSSAQFVEPLRRDVDALLDDFARDWGRAIDAVERSDEQPESGIDTLRNGPFRLFLNTWIATGWNFVPFAFTEDQETRNAFYQVVSRVFLGTWRREFSLFLSVFFFVLGGGGWGELFSGPEEMTERACAYNFFLLFPVISLGMTRTEHVHPLSERTRIPSADTPSANRDDGPDNPDRTSLLRATGALFALYALWGAQPEPPSSPVGRLDAGASASTSMSTSVNIPAGKWARIGIEVGECFSC